MVVRWVNVLVDHVVPDNGAVVDTILDVEQGVREREGS